MAKKRIAITGSRGIVGTILRRGLGDRYAITPIDRPETDVVKDYYKLAKILPGCIAAIHLA